MTKTEKKAARWTAAIVSAIGLIMLSAMLSETAAHILGYGFIWLCILLAIGVVSWVIYIIVLECMGA